MSGCWSQSSNKLLITAAIQLFAALTGAIAMATWHAALFLEMEKVHRPCFPLTWPDWLQEATTVGVGWSYFLVILLKIKTHHLLNTKLSPGLGRGLSQPPRQPRHLSLLHLPESGAKGGRG